MTTIAQTILSQLGGNRFIAMTGAKNLVNHGDALSFKLPARFARDGINCVKVSYDEGRDLYDLSFDRLHGAKLTHKAAIEGAYADDLQRLFTETTGLDTRL